MRMLRASTVSSSPETPVRPRDNLGRAEYLSDLDDGGAAQDGRHRQVQLIECVDAFGAGEGRPPAGVQFVGEDHGGRFSQPHEARLTLCVLEGDDQDPSLVAVCACAVP